jgi:hypothetical protein
MAMAQIIFNYQLGIANGQLRGGERSIAHSSLPIPSQARVVNRENGKEIIVTVTTRIPPSNRNVDLSPDVWRELELRQGAEIEIYPITTAQTNPPSPAPIVNAPASSSSYSLDSIMAKLEELKNLEANRLDSLETSGATRFTDLDAEIEKVLSTLQDLIDKGPTAPSINLDPIMAKLEELKSLETAITALGNSGDFWLTDLENQGAERFNELDAEIGKVLLSLQNLIDKEPAAPSSISLDPVMAKLEELKNIEAAITALGNIGDMRLTDLENIGDERLKELEAEIGKVLLALQRLVDNGPEASPHNLNSIMTKLEELKNIEAAITALGNSGDTRLTELERLGDDRFTELENLGAARFTELENLGALRFTDLDTEVKKVLLSLQDLINKEPAASTTNLNPIITKLEELAKLEADRLTELENLGDSRLTELENLGDSRLTELENLGAARFTDLDAEIGNVLLALGRIINNEPTASTYDLDPIIAKLEELAKLEADRLAELANLGDDRLTELENLGDSRLTALDTEIKEVLLALQGLIGSEPAAPTYDLNPIMVKLDELKNLEAAFKALGNIGDMRLTELERLGDSRLTELDTEIKKVLLALEGITINEPAAPTYNSTYNSDPEMIARLRELEAREARRVTEMESRELEILKALEDLTLQRLNALEDREADRIKALEEALALQSSGAASGSGGPSTSPSTPPSQNQPSQPNRVQPPTTVQPVPAKEVLVIPGIPDPTTDKVYRLQVGAFSAPEAADRTSRLVASLGFHVIQEQSGPWFRVYAIDVPAVLIQSAAQRLGLVGISEVWVRE